MLRRIIGLVLVAAAVSATASAQDVKLPKIAFGCYHALVIGNNDYQHLPKLATAVNDATATDRRMLLRVTWGTIYEASGPSLGLHDPRA